MNYIKKFRVEPGSKVDLEEVDAGFKDKHESHEHALPEIVTETLESLNMKFPEPTVDIDEIKKKYHAIVEEEEEKQDEQADDKKNKKGKKASK